MTPRTEPRTTPHAGYLQGPPTLPRTTPHSPVGSAGRGVRGGYPARGRRAGYPKKDAHHTSASAPRRQCVETRANRQELTPNPGVRLEIPLYLKLPERGINRRRGVAQFEGPNPPSAG